MADESSFHFISSAISTLPCELANSPALAASHPVPSAECEDASTSLDCGTDTFESDLCLWIHNKEKLIHFSNFDKLFFF